MILSISLVAVCWSSDSVRSRLRCCSVRRSSLFSRRSLAFAAFKDAPRGFGLAFFAPFLVVVVIRTTETGLLTYYASALLPVKESKHVAGKRDSECSPSPRRNG